MLSQLLGSPGILVPVAAFVLVTALWLAGVLLWGAHKEKKESKLEERLDIAPEAEDTRLLRLWRQGEEATTTVRGRSRERSLMGRVNAALRQAGMETSAARFLTLVGLGSVLLAILVFLVSARIWLALAVPFVGWLVLNIYIQHKINQRQELFETQFLDSMHVAATSLRAGHPLSGAFHFVSSEVEPPVGELFAQIWEEQQLGVDLQQAVKQAADRSGNDDLKLFATSVSIQIRSGGNLADMMERLSDVIRDRIKRRRRLRVITAQTQFSKRILLAFPFVFLVLMNAVYPGYTDPLFDTTGGKIAVIVAGGLLLVGAWVMNRMARIEY